MSPKATTDDDSALKRLPGGGGWQTRDGRFTIASESGTWSLLDAEQTDDLGLPLVRGPFRSLGDAKAAMEAARGSAPVTSSLADRKAAAPRTATKPAPADGKPAKPRRPEPPPEPPEPRWITELGAAERRRARRLLDELERRGVRDAEGIVRRDVAGDVPTVARAAVADAVAAGLGDSDAAGDVRLAGRVLKALVEGRDDALDVRWRLVDDTGRPIGVTPDDVAAALKRKPGD